MPRGKSPVFPHPVPTNARFTHTAFMNTKNQRAFLSLELAASVNKDGWVMIFPAGKQTGHDGRGPYVLENMEAVLAASQRPSVKLQIDYDHATDMLKPGEKKIAAGWIEELAARDDGIYARIEWTPTAAQHIADKEYRYLSPTFYFDKVSGVVTQILRAALTNTPNLEVKAVAAAEDNPQPQKENTMDEAMKAIAAALGLGEDATAASILEAVQKLANDAKAAKEQVTAATKALASAQIADPAKFVPIEVVQELQKSIAAIQKDTAASKAQASVDVAIENGKVTPAMKDWALSLATANPVAFADFVKAAPAIVTAGAEDTGKKKNADGSLDDEEKVLASFLGLSEEQFKAGKTAQA